MLFNMVFGCFFSMLPTIQMVSMRQTGMMCRLPCGVGPHVRDALLPSYDVPRSLCSRPDLQKTNFVAKMQDSQA
jgi:hypothetical protein